MQSVVAKFFALRSQPSLLSAQLGRGNFSLFKSFNLYRETALQTRFDSFQMSNTWQRKTFEQVDPDRRAQSKQGGLLL